MNQNSGIGVKLFNVNTNFSLSYKQNWIVNIALLLLLFYFIKKKQTIKKHSKNQFTF